MCVNTLAGTHPQADTSELERKIDQLVYQLPGLTQQGIDILEENDNKFLVIFRYFGIRCILSIGRKSLH